MAELQKMAEFLDIPLTDEKKKEIAEKTEISNMRKEYKAKNLPDGLIYKGMCFHIQSTLVFIDPDFL